MAAVPGQAKPSQMSTERIQEMLEENFKFIRVIAEQQNLGRMHEVHQYQQKLQENLMLLAAVADTYAPSALAGGGAQAAPAPAAPTFRPPAPVAQVAPNPAAALGQFPVAAAAAGAAQQLMMGIPGVAGQPGAVQLTPQQLQVMQQALARQQQQQQQQYQLPQAQAMNALGGFGLVPGGQPGAAAGVGGFQLPAPPPLNLGT